jgi:hypothetical protein
VIKFPGFYEEIIPNAREIIREDAVNPRKNIPRIHLSFEQYRIPKLKEFPSEEIKLETSPVLNLDPTNSIYLTPNALKSGDGKFQMSSSNLLITPKVYLIFHNVIFLGIFKTSY